MKKRYLEIDLMRGAAICMMVIYHTLWDANYFLGTNIALQTGFWKLFQLSTAGLFLFVVGLSLQVSGMNHQPAKKYLKRGGIILILGVLITLVTWLLFAHSFVRFGILHCIGASIILMTFFRHIGRMNYVVVGMIFALGLWTAQIHVASEWLVVFGITPHLFVSVDYYPLLPWFAVVLLGYQIAAEVYPHDIEVQHWFQGIGKKPAHILSYLGRHSLTIYMAHQPVLFVVFLLMVR